MKLHHCALIVLFPLILVYSSLNAFPGTPDSPVLLFSSGFENIEVAPGNWQDAESSGEHLRGTDSVTGFDWEKSWQPYVTDAFLQYCCVRETERGTYTTTKVIEEPHPDGRPGGNHILYLGVKGDDPLHPANTRNELNLYTKPGFTQAYGRYWMKIHPNLREQIPGRTWVMVMEWKEPGDPNSRTGGTNNWRTNIALQTQDDMSLAWRFMRQQVQPVRFTEQVVTNVAAPVIVGEWFLVETYWRWGKNGRIWFAINGETVFDQYGRFEHPDNPLGLKFWAPFKNYRGKEWYDKDLTNGDETWFAYDDFEVWSDFPEGHPQRAADEQIIHIETFDQEDTEWGEIPSDWWFEGAENGSRARVELGRIYIEADRENGQAGTLWWNHELRGDLEIEFDVRVESAIEQANNMNFFLMYRDPIGFSLYDTRHKRTDGNYSHYTRGDLEGTLVTFLADSKPERARFRMRRVPPFDPVLAEAYTYHARQGVTYHIRIRKNGNHVRYSVDGIERLSGYIDPPFAANTTGGYIGFRTWHTNLSWDNLVIRKLNTE